MRGNPVRKIKPVVNKIRSFVLLRSIIIKKHLLRNTETQKKNKSTEQQKQDEAWGARSFEMIRIKISDPRSLGSWWIK